ncbi:MAG: SAM-dependent methyltransferase [Streptosporangiaceae bacterium]
MTTWDATGRRRPAYHEPDISAAQREATTEQGQTSPDGSTPRAVTFDATVAHPARIYDYWLGGKDNRCSPVPWVTPARQPQGR